ncbi:MAG: hypothetical protein WBM62_00325 [Crocosphaera sp.]
MSLLHWDKSVLSLHLKEIIEDHQNGDSKAVIGLGAILLGTIALPAAAKLGRPVLKSIIKTGLSLSPQSTKTPSTVFSHTPAQKNGRVPH